MTGHFQPSYNPSWIGWILFAFVILFGFYGLWGCRTLYKNPNHRLRNFLIISWTIGPPVYFLFNYHIIFRYFGNNFDHYWRSQSLYTNIWAAIGAIMILIVTNKISKNDKDPDK